MKLDPLVRILVNEARQRRLTYCQFNKIAHQARRRLGLKPPHGPRHLPHILPDAVIDGAQNIQHQIMLRLLFYTAIRVAELNQGKRSKDRYVLFPDAFALVLQTHLAAHPQSRYLFESNRRTHYSSRMVQHIIQKYGRMAP